MGCRFVALKRENKEMDVGENAPDGSGPTLTVTVRSWPKAACRVVQLYRTGTPMRGADIETLSPSQMGRCGIFETSLPSRLDPNETISMAFGICS
jgi:hypothetical protein